VIRPPMVTVEEFRPRPHAIVRRMIGRVRDWISSLVSRVAGGVRSAARRLRTGITAARMWWQANRRQILLAALAYGGGAAASALGMPYLAAGLHMAARSLAAGAAIPRSLDEALEHEVVTAAVTGIDVEATAERVREALTQPGQAFHGWGHPQPQPAAHGWGSWGATW